MESCLSPDQIDLLNAWQAESTRLKEGDTPDLASRASVELFYPLAEQVSYRAFTDLMQGRAKALLQKPALWNAPRFMTVRHTKDLIYGPTRQAIQTLAAELPSPESRNWLRLGIKACMARDLNQDGDLNSYCHQLAVEYALTDERLLVEAKSGKGIACLEAQAQLYQDRVPEAMAPVLRSKIRMRHFFKTLDGKLRQAGVEPPPLLAFGTLAEWLLDRGDPHGQKARLHQGHLQYLEYIKAELAGKPRKLEEELKKIREDHAIRSSELAAHEKLPRETRREYLKAWDLLNGRNPATQKALQRVKRLLNRTRTRKASTPQVLLELDSRPNLKDLDTASASLDCSGDAGDLFARPDCWCVRVYLRDGGNRLHKGNIYLLKGSLKAGATCLHIDAIQTPIPVAMDEFCEALIPHLIDAAKGLGSTALTCNFEPFHISNHASVQKGFVAAVGKLSRVRVRLPSSFQDFQSYGADHQLIRSWGAKA